MKQDYAEREKALYNQLGQSPIVEVVGAMKSRGVGGTGNAVTGEWTLWFALEAWKLTDSTCNKAPLTVQQTGLSKDQFDETAKMFLGSEGFLELRVKLAQDSVFGTPQALLLEVIDSDLADPEIAEAVAQLNAPREFKDLLFGTFRFDRHLNWYQATVEWCHQSIELNLEIEEQDQPAPVASTAHRLWEDEAGWNQAVLECAAKKLLDTAHNWAREGNEEPPSPEDFKARMTLESITVHPDGRFEFWFDDGDLFWGHSIEVRGSLEEGPTEASMAG